MFFVDSRCYDPCLDWIFESRGEVLSIFLRIERNWRVSWVFDNVSTRKSSAYWTTSISTLYVAALCITWWYAEVSSEERGNVWQDTDRRL